MVNLDGRLKLHDAMSHVVHRIGAEGEPLLVIDTLFADPQVLTDFAAEHAAAFGHADTFFPGKRLRAPEIYSFAVRAFLGELIAKVFGIAGRSPVRERCEFSVLTTPPAQLRVPQRLPHADSTDPNQLAFLHFLEDPECDGTAFYRHRSTGFETVTQQRLAPYRDALQHELSHRGAPAPGYINGDTDLFERVARVEARPNRLIVYRGMLLHSADIPPGRMLSNAPGRWRLTLNSFLFFA